MAWIESHQTLRAHPKTRKAARALGIRPVHLIGHLHALWHWALDLAEDGDLSKFDAEDIAIAADWDDDPEQFVQALIDCGPGDSPGFLERDGSLGAPENGRTGALVLHDWWDYAGKLIASRQAARDDGARGNHVRHHVQKGIVNPDCPFCSGGDSPPESGGDRGGESGGVGTRSGPGETRSGQARTPPTQPHQSDRNPPPPAQPEEAEAGPGRQLLDAIRARLPDHVRRKLDADPGNGRLAAALLLLTDTWPPEAAAEALTAGDLADARSIAACLRVRAETLARASPDDHRPTPAPSACPDCHGVGITWNAAGTNALTCTHPRIERSA